MKKLTNYQRQRLAIAAEIASYGLDWCAPEDGGLSVGNQEIIETIAHMLACCVCQWVFPSDSIGTSETMEFLKLDEFPDRVQIEDRLLKYIESL